MSQVGDSLRAIVKMVLKSRPSGVKAINTGSRPLYIMGNGPSLRQVLDNKIGFLQENDTMAVNFAANTPEFFNIRPRYYTLADPHFFDPKGDINVLRLISNIDRIDWDMTLFVPQEAGRSVKKSIVNPQVKVCTYNAVGIEGWGWLTRIAYNNRWAMPRPRNVLIPSIMIGAWLGYKEIYLLGADHTWPLMLSVTDDNRVITNQPHFYADDDSEKQRVERVYSTIPLHAIFDSYRIAFKAYHDIARWARHRGIVIYNATPGSFIDAFPRRVL